MISIVILVFSDSHKRTAPMLDLISNIGPDAVVHLGDVDDDIGEIPDVFPDIPLYAVSGNNDYSPSFPMYRTVRFGDKKLFLTHGHLFGVRHGTNALAAAALREGADIALFGHTHVKSREKKGSVLLLNPGSISLPRSGRPSFLRLEIEGGALDYKIAEI